MRAVVQRVSRAQVAVDGTVVGACGVGLLVLLGVAPEDGDVERDWLAKKLVSLRIFPDEHGRFDRSLLDIDGEALVISQFTVFGDCRKGRRPNFSGAAAPMHAEPLYLAFCQAMRDLGVRCVAEGVFGANMAVELVNDGPVTLTLETPRTL